MSTELTKKQRDKIAGELRNVHANLKFKWGHFLTSESELFLFMAMYDCNAPKSYERWFGDRAALVFVPAYLQHIARFENHGGGEESPISEFPALADAEATAVRVVNAFSSLPWKYTVSISLPEKITEVLTRLDKPPVLTDSQRFILPADPALTNFPLSLATQEITDRIHSRGFLMMGTPPEWDAHKAVFQCSVEGYVGPYGEGLGFEVARDQLKAICGLGTATGLLKVRPDYTQSRSHFLVHRLVNDEWQLETKLDAGAELSRSLNWLVAVSYDDKNVQEVTRNAFAGIAVPFRAGERGNRILLAARWLFEGSTGHDDLLNFVQCMIVLEILLGDAAEKPEASLSAILATRCAYAVADTRSEREKIEKEFRELYRLRSKIVHTGHARLNADERGSLTALRRLCARVLRHEVFLMSEELKAESRGNKLGQLLRE